MGAVCLKVTLAYIRIKINSNNKNKDYTIANLIKKCVHSQILCFSKQI